MTMVSVLPTNASAINVENTIICCRLPIKSSAKCRPFLTNLRRVLARQAQMRASWKLIYRVFVLNMTELNKTVPVVKVIINHAKGYNLDSSTKPIFDYEEDNEEFFVNIVEGNSGDTDKWYATLETSGT